MVEELVKLECIDSAPGSSDRYYFNLSDIGDFKVGDIVTTGDCAKWKINAIKEQSVGIYKAHGISHTIECEQLGRGYKGAFFYKVT